MRKKNIFVLCLVFVISFLALNYVGFASNGDLVAYYKFDEGSGSIVSDIIGNGNSGTIYGAKWVDGKHGKALSFDGDDYVSISHNNKLDLGNIMDYSVAVWIRTIEYDMRDIVAKDDGTGVYPLSLRIWDGLVGLFVYDGNSAPGVYSTGALVNDGKWHHVVGVRSTKEDKLKIYVDGELVESVTDTTIGSIANTDSMTVGNGGNNYVQYGFHGEIDDVRIYNKALSDEEVKQIYGNVIICTDSDGGNNLFLKGQTQDSSGNLRTDYCMDNASDIAEFYCKDDTIYGNYTSCPSGYSCSGGACIKETTCVEEGETLGRDEPSNTKVCCPYCNTN